MKKTIFIIIAFAFLIGMFGLAELLAKVVTMDFFMNIVYIMLGFGFVYIFNN